MLVELDGFSGDWEVKRVWLRKQPKFESIVLRCYDRGTDRIVAIKANKRRKRNKEHFDALVNLRRFTPNCVAAHALSADRSFFVMEWIDAPLLNKQIRSKGPVRHEAILRAATWLARLRDVTVGRNPPHGSSLFRIRPPHVYRGPVGAAASRLRKRMRTLGPFAGPVVALHVDFHAGNLFAAREHLLAFDRQFNKHGVAYYDAAWFLCHLALMRSNALINGNPMPGTYASDRQSFFEGYGAIEAKDLTSFDLIEDIALLKLWYAHFARGNHRVDSLAKMYGLPETELPRTRPGRLVAEAENAAVWSIERAH